MTPGGLMQRRAFARGRNDRGSVIMEAAIVVPLLFMMIFGIIDLGGVLKSYSSTAHAVRASARMASVAGNAAQADRAILERMSHEAVGLPKGEVLYAIVWHATGPGDVPPAACHPTSTSVNTTSVGVSDGGTDAVGACNVYIRPDATGGAFDMATGKATQPATYYFGCAGSTDPLSSQKVDCKWPAVNRRVKTTPRSATTQIPPDFVGIYIKVKHMYYSRVIAKQLTITDSGIALLEPQGYQLTS